MDIQSARAHLPVSQHKETIIQAIRKKQHCIIISPTGSGKTTQIPQFLHEYGFSKNGIIAVTQPRRVAAISVARRVAQEMNQGSVGNGPVGYCVRFDDCSSPKSTKIRFMTDGMLLREAVCDPSFARYRCIVLDEAHERGLNTDVLFGIVLNAAKTRLQALKQKSNGSTTNGLNANDKTLPTLKIIIMSATIDPKVFVDYLGQDYTNIIYVQSRPHPIKLLSLPTPSQDYVLGAASACLQVHRHSNCPLSNGILIFMTGEEEITRCCNLIKQFSSPSNSNIATNLTVFPLFAALPQHKQLEAIDYSNQTCRKVIVSTNIAETSLTIPGIRYVIDCGYAKMKFWDPQSNIESYRVKPISKSQACQRAGRSGREAPGVCLRLYTDQQYNSMPLHPEPELERTALSNVVLSLVAMNVSNPRNFDWLSKPSEQTLEASTALLQRLGAIEYAVDASHSNQPLPLYQPLRLTPLGRLMTAFPLEPRYSRTLLSAASLNCLVEALTVLSMLFVSPVFYVPQNKRDAFREIQTRYLHPEGDLAMLINVFRGFIQSNPNNKNSETSSDSSNNQQSNNTSRSTWCRVNMVNMNRIQTARRVRNQLKTIVRGCGLGGRIHSCGSDFSRVTQAFIAAGFRHQIATLANSDPATKKLNQSLPAYTPLASINDKLVRSNSTSSPIHLHIHPDSTLACRSLSSQSPTHLVYVETVESGSSGEDEQARIYMRHVAVVKPDWLLLPLRAGDDDLACLTSTSKPTVNGTNGTMSSPSENQQKRKQDETGWSSSKHAVNGTSPNASSNKRFKINSS